MKGDAKISAMEGLCFGFYENNNKKKCLKKKS
jgi:hypothetical protein